jgi:bifunctional UDP-N-acetylglucosamine pyrophosphorylase/glucosamine-1-phosphate N-acetyltransferase
MASNHIVILAAGEGTRMKSQTPKPLFPLLGTPTIDYILNAAFEFSPKSISTVLRYKADEIKSHIDSVFDGVNFVTQGDADGTGAAVKDWVNQFSTTINQDDNVIILGGDAPLVNASILYNLVQQHNKTGNLVSMATTKMANPIGYGRIVRNQTGAVKKIVEEKETTDIEKTIQEVNCSVYCIRYQFLKEAIFNLENSNSKGEFYLTDLVELADGKVDAYIEPFSMLLKSFNDRAELSEIERFLLLGAANKLMKSGVSVANALSLYIEPSVIVEEDVTILEGCRLCGDTVIKSGAVIGPNTILQDTEVGNNAVVESSKVIGAVIKERATVGPFSYIRPGTEVGEASKVGAFVEVKNSKIGNGSKTPHLSYIGDTTIGENSNLGAGTITANYDGKNKHQTKIGDNCKIGSDTVIVAPVKIGDGVYSGAGSVIREDVATNTLVYSENSLTKKSNYKKEG